MQLVCINSVCSTIGDHENALRQKKKKKKKKKLGTLALQAWWSASST